MPHLKTTMDVFKLLPKTNCRKCNAPTCLAFAAAVFQEQRPLSDCPYVPPSLLKDVSLAKAPASTREEDMIARLKELKRQASRLDLAQRAAVLGGTYRDGKLILKILGKEFAISHEGELITDIHVNPWISVPVFDYLLNAKGTIPTESWVSLRELKDGQTWYNFFAQRCEKPLKRVADTYPDLFEDMVHLFNGRQISNHYQADISVVLHPLPRVPILICYLKPDEGLDSNLSFFLDDTAVENLSIQSIYTMGAGLANMFEKIALRHGVRTASYA